MSKRKIIFLSIVSIVMIPIAIWLINYQVTFPTPESRSEQEIISAVQRSRSNLFNKDGSPIFTIASVSHPDRHWYIVEITNKEGYDGLKSKLLINDPYFDLKKMHVVTGPNTSFSKNEVSSIPLAIPSNVQEKLYGDNK